MNSKQAQFIEDMLDGKVVFKEGDNVIFDYEDIMLRDNIFDDENEQKVVFSDQNDVDKHDIVPIQDEIDNADNLEEDNKYPQDETAETKENIDSQTIIDESQDKENNSKQEQQNENRKYGKFKNPEELLHAYGELEKEFTRRSQRLKELENAKFEPFKTEDDWRQAVDKFFEETPSAKVFAKDIANEIIDHPELKQDRNCLNIALTRALVSKFRTPEQLMSDGQFLKDYVLCSKEVKDAVIKEYLQGIKAGEPPFVLGGGGMQFASSPKSPKTIEEAGFMFLKENK